MLNIRSTDFRDLRAPVAQQFMNRVGKGLFRARTLLGAALPCFQRAWRPAGSGARQQQCAELLEEARMAIRLAFYDQAERILQSPAVQRHVDPARLNLEGVIHESRQEWKLARKAYGEAITLNRNYLAAQQNMRRMYELITFGHSRQRVAL
jgi:hypothetical protein